MLEFLGTYDREAVWSAEALVRWSAGPLLRCSVLDSPSFRRVHGTCHVDTIVLPSWRDRFLQIPNLPRWTDRKQFSPNKMPEPCSMATRSKMDKSRDFLNRTEGMSTNHLWLAYPTPTSPNRPGNVRSWPIAPFRYQPRNSNIN